jgi:hypothetical protein
MIASFLFTFKELQGKHAPNLIDIDRQRAETVTAKNHVNDLHLLSVDLCRLVTRIDEKPRNQLSATVPHPSKVDLGACTPYPRDHAA